MMSKQIEDMLTQIAKLKEENECLKEEIENLEDAHYNDIDECEFWESECYKLQDKLRNTKQINIVKEIKDYINNKIVKDFGDGADGIVYYTLDIDEFFDKLDDLTKED